MPIDNLKVDELYNFAIERCSFLMEDSKYRKIILSDDDLKITLAKGYFQGFYEALQMINAQTRKKTSSSPKLSLKLIRKFGFDSTK
jgi:hypothetical protein